MVAEVALPYEATMLAAIANARCNRVWLTFLGGRAFGNAKSWIASVIDRSLQRVAGHALDVRIAHHQSIDDEMVALINEARAR